MHSLCCCKHQHTQPRACARPRHMRYSRLHTQASTRLHITVRRCRLLGQPKSQQAFPVSAGLLYNLCATVLHLASGQADCICASVVNGAFLTLSSAACNATPLPPPHPQPPPSSTTNKAKKHNRKSNHPARLTHSNRTNHSTAVTSPAVCDENQECTCCHHATLRQQQQYVRHHMPAAPNSKCGLAVAAA